MAAGNSVIGALRVSLGLDSAAFAEGLKKAETGLARFSKASGIAFAAVTAAALTAGAALSIAVKGAIDNADALSKAAQKVGVTTEALSRLEFAAKLADVSLEQLTGGLGKLSKSMLDVSGGSKGPAATAFAALGIAVTDAAGQLRSADSVFADVAERFGRMEDGSTKTALAISLFGRAGAEMIPLLNAGRDGLKAMADESDRLGNTISSKTGRAAEQFNDNLTRLSSVMDGLFNKVMEASIDGLVRLTNTMASAEFQGAVANTIGLITTLADILARTAVLAYEVANILPKALGKGEDDAVAAMNEDFGKMSPEEFKKKYQLGDEYAAGGSKAAPAALPTLDVKPFVADLDALASAGKVAKETLDPFAARMQELAGVLTETVDPFSQMKNDLTDLKTMFDSTRIGADQFGTAVAKTVAGAVASFSGLAGEALSALSQIFQGNKALAVSSAIVNGIGSVAKTLETYGVTPWGIAAAGVAGLTAAANVASILSTTETSKSMPGVSAPSAGVAAPAGGGAGAGMGVNITLQGDTHSTQSVRDLFAQLQDYLGDQGKRISVSAI